MKTANVIKIPIIGIVIVTNVTDDYVNWVSFDHENVSGGGKMKDHVTSRACFCDETNGGLYDRGCEYCHGTGSIDVNVAGLEKAEILAPNVKSYILRSLTKNFDF